MKSDWKSSRDVLAALVCAAVGALAATLVFFKTGQLYFYQSYMPDLIYAACGFGLVHPAEIPQAASDFLFLKVTSLDCAALGVPAAIDSPSLFTQAHLYLAFVVSTLWRISSVKYQNLWPLVALLAGGYAAAGFAVLRLFFGRLFATGGGLVLSLSPVTLSMIALLRDFSKGLFIVWAIVLLLLARRARSRNSLLARASLAGVVVGIGYGFRSDPILLLPIGVLFLVIGLEWGTWKIRAGAVGLFIASTLLFASPLLFTQKQLGFGTIFMEGMSEPFRIDLDLGAAPYAVGQRYSDELVLSSVAAELRPKDPEWDAHEGRVYQSISQAIGRSSSYVKGWIDLFSGDLATQAIKSAAWIIGFPALVAPGRAGLDPGGWARFEWSPAQPVSFLYNHLGLSWMPALCGLGLAVFFWRLTADNSREALATFCLFAALLCYPVVQFAVRHVFHFEFVWMLAVLALVHLPFDRAKLRSVALRFSVACGVLLVAILIGRAGLVAYQDHALGDQFSLLLRQPRESVEFVKSEAGQKAILNVPVPEQHRALVEGPPDSMANFLGVGVQWEVRAAADRLLLTLGGPLCSSGKFNLSFHYVKHEGVWQPFDHGIAVDLPQEGSGETLVLVPAFYRPSQYFSDIELPEKYANCLAKVERIAGSTRLPVILTAVLAPGWRDRPLHRAFGGFPVDRRQHQ